jgi:hypothetical protein
MTKYIILLFVTLPLLGCLNPLKPKLHSVMSSCDTPDFSDFNSCIQRSYERSSGSDVMSMYAQLNAIEEDQKSGKISQTKAKALAYKVYDATVGASNREARANNKALSRRLLADRPITCNTYGSTTTCY